jgi:hypothetical protein
MNRVFTFIAVLLLYASASAETDMEAAADDAGDADIAADFDTAAETRVKTGIRVMTPDGRHVLLMEDYTWEYVEIEPGVPDSSAVMTVANIHKSRNACKIGLKLTNNLGFKIKSLVPSFTAYTGEGVRYETVSKAFSSIKPTLDQYRQIQFIGLRCEDIDRIQVHGADHCNMGPLDKFTQEMGKCLGYIHVQASDLIEISK